MQVAGQDHLAVEAVCYPKGFIHERGSQAVIGLFCYVDKVYTRPACKAAVVGAAAKVALYLGVDPLRCANLWVGFLRGIWCCCHAVACLLDVRRFWISA